MEVIPLALISMSISSSK